MITRTETYKTNISTNGRGIDVILKCDNGTTIDADNIQTIKRSFNTDLLKSVMKELYLELSIQVPKKTIINFNFGVFNRELSNYEYIDLGNYIVYENSYNEDTRSYNHKCYDLMLNSMVKNYAFIKNYPISIRDYINELSNVLGLEFANKTDEFTNYDKMINSELYAGLEFTFRDIYDQLSEVVGGNICINSEDKVEIRYIKETNDTIDSEFLKDADVEFGQKFGPVNTITLARSAGADAIFIEDTESVETDGRCEIRIEDNQIMNWQDRSDFLPELLSRLNGLEYSLNDYASTGITYYEVCDKYTVETESNTYSCVMFNSEINIFRGLEELVHTRQPRYNVTDFARSNRADREDRRMKLLVDYQGRQIIAAVSRITANEEDITNLSLKADSIEMNVTQIRNRVTNNETAIDALEYEIGRLSGIITHFTGTGEPLPNEFDMTSPPNYPAEDWVTIDDKKDNIDNVYTDRATGYSWRWFFDYTTDEFYWIKITDSDATEAFRLATEALATAQSRTRIFFQDTEPEEFVSGDFWVDISSGNALKTAILNDDGELVFVPADNSILAQAFGIASEALNQADYALSQIEEFKEIFDNFTEEVSTNFTQTNNSFNFMIQTLLTAIDSNDEAVWEEFAKQYIYWRFTPQGIEFGRSVDQLMMRKAPDRLSFLVNNVERAFLNHERLSIDNINLRDWLFTQEQDGSFSIKRSDN